MSKPIQYTPQSEMLYCQECKAPFATHSGLRYHMKAMHNGYPESKKVQTFPVTKAQANYKTNFPVNVNAAGKGKVVKVLEASSPASKIKAPANPKLLKADDIAAELVSSVDDIPEGIVYECTLCQRQDGVLLEMEIHMWSDHSEHLTTPKSTKKFISCRCTACGENLYLNYRTHTCRRKTTAPVSTQSTPSHRRSCGACFKGMAGPWALAQHAQTAHSDHAEVLYFPTKNEYTLWKLTMEAATRVQYAQCGQQGPTVLHKCAVEASGLMCPSMMLVETLSNGIKVNFHKYHFSHDHQPYKIDNKHKKYHLTEFLKSSNQLDIDLYIQFKNLMENIVLEAAKLDKFGLTNIFGKALQLALSLTDDGKAPENDDDEQDPDDDEQIPVDDDFHDDDGDGDVLEELIVPEVLDTPVKRPLDTVIGQKVTVIGEESLTDSYRRPSVRLKKKMDIMNAKPILKKDATPAKRLKRSVTIANDVPIVECMPKIVNVKSEVTSQSFNDSYKNFVEENLGKDADKRGAFKETPLRVTSKVVTPKNVPPPKKVSTKRVTPKKLLRTKLGQFRPRRHSEEPIKVDLTKVKIEGYEVKERENDCNILVLKI